MEFDSKTVLVTGATSGIGRETAKAFAARGARVIITGRDMQRAESVLAEIDNDSAVFIPADLSSHEAVQRLIRDAGPADVLINDAGYWELGATAETSQSGFDTMFAVNVRAPFFLTAAYAPQMAANGGGSIVNVSTMVAARGMAGMAAYGASKAALESLTRAWAAEYGPQGVRVNALALGPTLTPAMDPLIHILDDMVGAIPLRRAAEPTEIAQTIVYLASKESSYITGAVVPVDAGRAAVL